MKLKIIILGLFISVFLCCKKNQSKEIVNNELKGILNNYVKENPLKLIGGNNFYKEGFSYPSYHVFFENIKSDTVVTIVQLPHLIALSLRGKQNTENEIFYEEIVPKGYFMLDKKNPVIIIDAKNYGGNYYNKNNLKEVPDSLKFNQKNVHSEYIRWNFKVKNNKLVREIK
ncbi:hypothetical protein ACE939_03525 [Aquimarina sp. W85]|uniref:hypothetical protein n=1 Tax=Aquimarina rhodophyticola TaxID=3342246 RepID=UPI0036726F49